LTVGVEPHLGHGIAHPLLEGILSSLLSVDYPDVDEIIAAVMQATEYWHQHRSPYLWKKAVRFRNKTTKCARCRTKYDVMG
jgi:hypothetical protein